MARETRPGPSRVTFVVFPGALLLDLAGPLQVFAMAGEAAPESLPVYEIRVVSAEGGLVRTSAGLPIMTEPLAAAEASDTVIVAGGPGVHAASRDARLTAWLAEHARTARRVCSVCTGAFLLASADLLCGRRAVTHWDFCSRLGEQYPETIVMPDPIYVNDGRLWTSAGATAGIDLALALVTADLGHAEAIRIARRLVVFVKRAGGQAQFSVPLGLQARDDGEFEALHHWMQGRLGEDLSVEVLAAEAGMSPRTFARRYVQRVGRTPAKSVEALRLEAARRALEDTKLSLKQIALRCGFHKEERMQRAFRRQLGVSPLEYRSRFAAPPH